ncbi:MAG TPA: SDR family oxidoreductase [Acidimicrobiia bacterium]|jgi:NAD(P)-dependent dehydrogenase (short-subunit alcohol dehydrogenase family)
MGVIAVTGSAGGIGGAIRRQIEAEGHDVIGVDVRDAEVVADLSSAAGRSEALDGIREAAGPALDGLVVAAGIGGSTSAPPSMVARINYFGAVALLDGLREPLARGALHAAVAISSNSATAVPAQDLTLVEHCLSGREDEAADHADTLDGELVYAHAKLALARRVRRLAVEWAPDVRVNAVAPGPVLTPLTQAALEHPVTGDLIRSYPIPLDRWGEPEEIAAGVWFLLSPAAAWITGVLLFIDGGTDALLRPDGI